MRSGMHVIRMRGVGQHGCDQDVAMYGVGTACNRAWM